MYIYICIYRCIYIHIYYKGVKEYIKEVEKKNIYLVVKQRKKHEGLFCVSK